VEIETGAHRVFHSRHAAPGSTAKPAIGGRRHLTPLRYRLPPGVVGLRYLPPVLSGGQIQTDTCPSQAIPLWIARQRYCMDLLIMRDLGLSKPATSYVVTANLCVPAGRLEAVYAVVVESLMFARRLS
jgi:hypothetical protein